MVWAVAHYFSSCLQCGPQGISQPLPLCTAEMGPGTLTRGHQEEVTELPGPQLKHHASMKSLDVTFCCCFFQPLLQQFPVEVRGISCDLPNRPLVDQVILFCSLSPLRTEGICLQCILWSYGCVLRLSPIEVSWALQLETENWVLSGRKTFQQRMLVMQIFKKSTWSF